MSKTIQIRHVPDDLHRLLEARASSAGKTLTEYVRDQLLKATSRPTPDEMLRRLRGRQPVRLSRPVAEWVREQRDVPPGTTT